MPSLVIGSIEPPLLELTIGQALDAAARRHGDNPALIDGGQQVRLTWAELHERVSAFGSGLLAAGLGPDDRIGIWSLNRVECTLTQFAAAKAGLVLVTINPAYRVSELEFALAKASCAAVVLPTRFKTSDYIGMIQSLLPEMATAEGSIQSLRLPALRLVIQMDGNPVGKPYGALWCSYDVHRRARESEVRRIRSHQPQNRYHGGLALPARNHATGG